MARETAVLVDQFAAALTDAQGEILECDSWEALLTHARVLAGGDEPVVAPATVEEAADRPVGVARAALAVAETGSLLLIEPRPETRTPSLLTRHLVVGVSRTDLVATLDDAFAWLASQPRAGGYATFVTGPSRTADIERSLTIGVQGPSRLTAALLP